MCPNATILLRPHLYLPYLSVASLAWEFALQWNCEVLGPASKTLQTTGADTETRE